MAFEVKQGRIEFEPHEGSANRELSVPIQFSRTIRKINLLDDRGQRPVAWAMITGFSVGFADGDRPFQALSLDLGIADQREAPDVPNSLMVRGTLALRDASGRFDDRFRGSIRFTVVADVIE